MILREDGILVEAVPLFRIKQHLPRPVVKNIEAAVVGELEKNHVGTRIKPGSRIAITAGSRGINNIPLIIRTAADYVSAQGGVPLVISAMGSHGGGTAEGQREVLESLGITEANVKCPVWASTDVVEIGKTPSHGVPVFCAREAVEADGLIVINRVKAHTAFRAPRESGLAKMLGIGLGRAPGAEAIHSQGVGEMGDVILELSRIVRQRLNILTGLAVVENGYEETALIQGLPPEDFENGEAELLTYAKMLQPRIPFETLDLLLVDEMGKNYSGTGMDTNVLGRWRIEGVPEPEKPHIARVIVLDLSEESHGNATGIGLADFTTRRLVNKIDFPATYLNCITSGYVQRAMIPITLDSDQEAWEVSLKTLNKEPGSLRVVRIKNTLHLDEMFCSEALMPEIKANSELEVLDGPWKMKFSREGNLIRG